MRSMILVAALAIGSLASPLQRVQKRYIVTEIDWETVTKTVYVTLWEPAPTGEPESIVSETSAIVSSESESSISSATSWVFASPTVSVEPRPSELQTPEATSEPEPESSTEPEPEPTTVSEPEPTAEPEPEPTTEPEQEPEPTSESPPEPTSEPQPEPTSEPQPEPTSEPQPEPTSEPQPEPTSEPQPEPTSEPESESTSEAAPETRPTGSVPSSPLNPHVRGEIQATFSSGPDYQASVLYHHNAARANHGARPLVWDDACEANALEAAKRCDFRHYIPQGAGQGQNLFTHSGSEFNVTAAITEAWYKGEFDAMQPYWGEANIPSDVFHEVGHLTAMLWKSTTKVGCVSYNCGDRMTVGGQPSDMNKYTVCNYASAGNIGGQYGEQVGAPISTTNLGSWRD